MRYRHVASFGKRMEYYFIGQMLKEGLDCYIPMVDDDGIDVVIRKADGQYIEVQIKARSNSVAAGDSALFAAMKHQARNNYYFVFYSERLNTMFIMSSAEYLAACVTNKKGKHIGTRSIWFNGYKTNRATGKKEEYVLPRFEKYIASDFFQISLTLARKCFLRRPMWKVPYKYMFIKTLQLKML